MLHYVGMQNYGVWDCIPYSVKRILDPLFKTIGEMNFDDVARRHAMNQFRANSSSDISRSVE